MYTSGQKKEEANLSCIFLLLDLPPYFQRYTPDIFQCIHHISK